MHAAALARAAHERHGLHRAAQGRRQGLRLFGRLGRRCAADRAQRARRRRATARRSRRAPRSTSRAARGRRLARDAVRRAHRRGARASSTPPGRGSRELLGQLRRQRRAAASGWSRAAISSCRDLFEGDHAYILQQPDRRIVFAIPYQGDFTEIGTTDVPVERPEDALIDDAEIAYLCDAANRYFTQQIAPADVVCDLVGRPPALRRRRERGEGGDARLCARARHRRPAAALGLRRQDHHRARSGRGSDGEARASRSGVQAHPRTRARVFPGGAIAAFDHVPRAGARALAVPRRGARAADGARLWRRCSSRCCTDVTDEAGDGPGSRRRADRNRSPLDARPRMGAHARRTCWSGARKLGLHLTSERNATIFGRWSRCSPSIAA